jgi:signal transduction histidine kinase
MTLDGATIVLGGGALVWYFVLGPTVLSTGEDLLAKTVSMAYPICDLLLLGAVAVLLLRHSPAALRLPLLWIAVAMLLTVVADTVYGYGLLHDTYTAGDPVDTLYVLEYCALAVAALTQRQLDVNDPRVRVSEDTRRYLVAAWLPYVGLSVGFGLLFAVQSTHDFFPDLSLVAIVVALAALVAVRQYLAQRELVQAQAQLRESERLKDEFLSVVGHELRTPLTSIRGSLGLLDGGVLGELPKDAANMVAVAVLNTERLGRLINDILDIERLAAGGLILEPVAVDAGELVSQAMQVVQATADGAAISLRSEVPCVQVLADADRIVQALVNLLANAVKFSNREGVVSVTVARRDHDALFSVLDSGRGIPADRLESIFERFRQVDASDAREKGGTGLGLPIARGIVEQHGGQMWAESHEGEGEGSALRFTLPLPGADLAGSERSPTERKTRATSVPDQLESGVL